MKELTEKLVDLRVKLTLAEKRLDEETNIDEVKKLGKEMQELRDEINGVEAEITEAEKVEETIEETNEEESEEEVVPATEESEEEKNEEVPTSEEVERSSDWTKVDESNVTKVASYEQRKGEVKMEKRIFTNEELEARKKDLVENRSVTVTSSNILLPEHVSTDLKDVPFKQYSSLVDRVNVQNFMGGESYEAPFTKSYGTAGLTTEGGDYETAEPEFDSVKVNKVKVTAYAEVSEEVEKLPAADYIAKVENNMTVALKKKLASQIILGNAASNNFVGIFSTNVANKCVLTTDDLEINSIGNDTLTDIVFNYGGDEEVEGVATLMLNKSDLLAFAKVRRSNGEKEYTINYVSQTIDGIPYILNSNITALASANEGDYVMAYGVPAHYEMPIFSDIEIMKSYDYKFKQGMIAFKSSVFTGGNTTSYRGFMRIKKGTQISG